MHAWVDGWIDDGRMDGWMSGCVTEWTEDIVYRPITLPDNVGYRGGWRMKVVEADSYMYNCLKLGPN